MAGSSSSVQRLVYNNLILYDAIPLSRSAKPSHQTGNLSGDDVNAKGCILINHVNGLFQWIVAIITLVGDKTIKFKLTNVFTRHSLNYLNIKLISDAASYSAVNTNIMELLNVHSSYCVCVVTP